LGAIAIALLSYVIPLAVAYKVVLVAPILLLPPVSWLSGRLAALPVPYPAMFAVVVLPFAFDDGCHDCGGNVASTALGEYAYSWGLTLGVLALALFGRLVVEGRGPVLTCVVLACALLAHPVTSIWVLVGMIATCAFELPWRNGDRVRLVAASAG